MESPADPRTGHELLPFMRFTETDQYQLLHGNVNLLQIYRNNHQGKKTSYNMFIAFKNICQNQHTKAVKPFPLTRSDPALYLYHVTTIRKIMSWMFVHVIAKSINFLLVYSFPSEKRRIAVDWGRPTTTALRNAWRYYSCIEKTSAQPQWRYYHNSRTSPKIHPEWPPGNFFFQIRYVQYWWEQACGTLRMKKSLKIFKHRAILQLIIGSVLILFRWMKNTITCH